MSIDNWEQLLEVVTQEFRDELVLQRYKAKMWERNQHRYPQYKLDARDFAEVLHDERQKLKRTLRVETPSEIYMPPESDSESPPGTAPKDSAPLAAEGGNSGSSGSSGSSIKGETIYSGYNEADIPGTARKGEN